MSKPHSSSRRCTAEAWPQRRRTLHALAAAALALCTATADAEPIRLWQCLGVRDFNSADCWVGNTGPAPGEGAFLMAPANTISPIYVRFPGSVSVSLPLTSIFVNGGNPNAPLELLVTDGVLGASNLLLVGTDAGATVRVGGSTAPLPDAPSFVGGTLNASNLFLGSGAGSDGKLYVDTAAASVFVANTLLVAGTGTGLVEHSAGSVRANNLLVGSQGTYNKSGGALTVTGVLDNRGLAQHSAGTLHFSNPTGPNLINSGFFQFDGGTLTGARVENTGQLSFSANAQLLSLANLGAVYVNGAQLGVAAAAFSNEGQVVLNGGTLQAKQLTNASGVIEGHGHVIATSIDNIGLIRAGAGGELTLQAAGGITNRGEIQLDAMNPGSGRVGSKLSGNAISNGGSIFGHGQIENAIVNQAGAGLYVASFDELLLTGAFTAQTDSTTHVDYDGLLRLAGRTTLADRARLSGGGAVWIEALLEIGGDAGDIGEAEAEGVLRLRSASRYRADIAGALAGSIDHLIANELELEGGTLELRSADGFVAQAGQRFDLFDWQRASGLFGSVEYSGLRIADGTFVNLSRLYLDGSISVDRLTDPPGSVPEPGTALLLGLALLAASRQRRKLTR